MTELTLFLIKSKDTACIIQVQILRSLVGLRMILCGMTSESLLPSALVSFGWCVLLYVPVSVSFYMCQWCECQTVICVREVGEWSNSKRQERSFRLRWIFFRDQTIGLLLNRGDVSFDNWLATTRHLGPLLCHLEEKSSISNQRSTSHGDDVRIDIKVVVSVICGWYVMWSSGQIITAVPLLLHFPSPRTYRCNCFKLKLFQKNEERPFI